MGQSESGVSQTYLFEYVGDVNYRAFLHLLNTFHNDKHSKQLALTRPQLREILSITQSDHERELVRYTACLASGLSSTGAQKHYGFQGCSKQVKSVELAIAEAKAIRSAFEGIAKIPVLSQFGIVPDQIDSSSDSSEPESDGDDYEG